MAAESSRAWWRQFWDAFTRSGVYDPATMAYRARMEALAARSEQRAGKLDDEIAPRFEGVLRDQLEREAAHWAEAARELRKEIASKRKTGPEAEVASGPVVVQAGFRRRRVQ